LPHLEGPVPLANGTVLEPAGAPTARLRRTRAAAVSWALSPAVSAPRPPRPPRWPLATAPDGEPSPVLRPSAPRSAAASVLRWGLALAALLVLLGAAAAVGLAL